MRRPERRTACHRFAARKLEWAPAVPLLALLAGAGVTLRRGHHATDAPQPADGFLLAVSDTPVARRL